MNAPHDSFPVSTCQVVASINEDTGGPAYSVCSLADSLAKCEVDSHLFTMNYPWHGDQRRPQRAHLHSIEATAPARWFRGFSVNARDSLEQLVAGRAPQTEKIDLLHNHGLWMCQNRYARLVANAAQIPLVISPRGMLEPWSLNRSSLRKKLAWLAFERANLRSAACFHATSIAEAQSIRAVGCEQPVAVIPNGVDLPDTTINFPRSLLEDLFPELQGKCWLVFLSRLHPKKGLDILLQAWSELYHGFSDWHLLIAGPDLTGYRPYLEYLTAKAKLQDKVTFSGMLTGDQRGAALQNADLFVLPSHSENYGLVVAESLSFATPVVTTRGTPWTQLETEHCGWQIELTTENLKEALFTAMSLGSDERDAMGAVGRGLIEQHYTWPTIALQMKQLYLWLLGRAEPPECLFWEEESSAP